MSLVTGARLGSYEVVAKLGEGGMGEVYRARDTKLGRDIALKILPESFASDPDRLMRFEREAKALASLNHPNIAAIYGLEDRALVMELVEGEDLSKIIAAGIPLADALPIARQIAEALEAAHEAGIIHRDLKPANIKVRGDGTVKVLDFGLAKAMSTGAEVPGLRSDVANSPTMTSPAMTAMGLILGTAAYMSPEQAKGRPADKRADIWAFGAVLYEMLAGQRAFQGEDVSDLLVAVLSKDVDLRALPANTPPSITMLLRRCLERDPRARLRDIGDARYLLDQAKVEMLGGVAVTGETPAAIPAPRRHGVLTWALAGITLASLALAVWSLTSRGASTRPAYLSIALPAGHALLSIPAISPNGEVLAFVSSDGVARPQLYIRRLAEPDSHLIAGTEDASEPFFSPDSRSLAFYARNALFKVSLEGGAPISLAESGSHNGGAWLDDGRIVFNRAWNGGFYSVPENGGPATLLVEPKRPQEYAYAWPTSVPGSGELIFARWGDTFTYQRLDLKTLTQSTITDGWHRSVYVPTGHLILGSDVNELWAVPFKAGASGSATVTGHTTVAEGVDGGSLDGDSRFAISDNGTLAYSGIDRNRRSLVAVDEVGRQTPTRGGEAAYGAFALSRDGKRVAAANAGELLIVDLDRGTSAPLVPELKSARQEAVWSLDGSRVIFSSNHEGNWEIYSKAASGLGTVEPVLRRPLDQVPNSVAPDGAMIFQETHPTTGRDLWMMAKGAAPEPWLVTQAQEVFGRFSPDGQLVAYQSNTSGKNEVYVQTRTTGGGRIQVSVDGGNTPVWSATGDRLYFRQHNAMMVATISTTKGLSAGPPIKLFDGGWELSGGFDFAVRPDGKSFLMVRRSPENIPTRIDLVLNWFTVLSAKMSDK